MRSDNEYPRTHQRRGCIFIYITALARIFGLITVASLGFVTYVEWSGIDSLIFPIYVTYVFGFFRTRRKRIEFL